MISTYSTTIRPHKNSDNLHKAITVGYSFFYQPFIVILRQQLNLYQVADGWCYHLVTTHTTSLLFALINARLVVDEGNKQMC